jgi:hypothetical protein
VGIVALVAFFGLLVGLPLLRTISDSQGLALFEAGCVAANRDLGTAFRLLADAIRARHLPPGRSN